MLPKYSSSQVTRLFVALLCMHDCFEFWAKSTSAIPQHGSHYSRVLGKWFSTCSSGNRCDQKPGRQIHRGFEDRDCPVRAQKRVSLSGHRIMHFYSECVDSRCLGDMTDKTWPGGEFDPFHTLVMVFFSRFFFGLLFLLFS